MKCPKCGDTENIKFFVRHQKSSEDDESTNANCLTILHADPECGFNESYLLEDCLDVVFPNWSEIQELESKVNEIQNNVNMGDMFAAMMGGMSNTIETEGEVIEDNELPPIQESEDIESENADGAIESDPIESIDND